MNTTYYAGLGGTLLVGILLFFYLATRKKYLDPSAAHNYEKIRNNVTVREPEVNKITKERSYSGHLPLGNLIGAFMVIVIADIPKR